jgi:hypothetical protein
MAVGLPAKTTYADGDVFSASDINDTNGTLNLVGQTTNFYAGKNKIINGDFGINQRAFTSNTATNAFNFDRWSQINTGGSFTVTPQVFTPGAAPVAGYEATNFLRGVSASQSAVGDRAVFRQKIEDVRTFAGQTITISFWAKAGSGTPKIGIEVAQSLIPSFTSIPVSAVTLSTSWVRYSATVAVPSLSGASISTGNAFDLFLWLSAGSDFATRASSIGIQNNTFDIWGVQVEAGSVATAFQTATGTIQGELAACQRYYYRVTAGQSGAMIAPISYLYSSTAAIGSIPFPVTMRILPQSMDYSNLNYNKYDDTAYALSSVSLQGTITTNNVGHFFGTIAGGTAGWVGRVSSSTSSGYLGFSAEL